MLWCRTAWRMMPHTHRTRGMHTHEHKGRDAGGGRPTFVQLAPRQVQQRQHHHQQASLGRLRLVQHKRCSRGTTETSSQSSVEASSARACGRR